MAKTPAKRTQTKKQPASVSKTPPDDKKPRRLKKPQYKSFRVHKHIKSEGATIPSSLSIMRGALGVLKHNWKLFLALSFIYGVLNFILVQGFSVTSLSETKATLEQAGHTSLSWLINGASLFAYLVTNSTSGQNPGASVYQAVIQVLMSLALIWTLRQLYAGRKVGIRDGFYQGAYPLVPFVLVLVVIAVQVIPAAIGVYLYSTVNGTGIAATTAEQILWAVVAFLAVLLSLYLICSSIIALYIVSLPNMRPMAALKSASQLVQFRRWAVLRKLLFLPLVMLIAGAVVLFPVILIYTPAAPWVFLLLSMVALPIVHSYVYALYRSLL